MRSPLSLKTYATTSGRDLQICLAPPHQFALSHQEDLLPDWNISLSYLILLLQQSSISLTESTIKVAQEKDYLRAKFIRFGCDLIFALQDHQHQSDLFDPRTGYPLIAHPAKTWDDNSAVTALLNYPVINYHQCSLLKHPVWQYNVYPGTIVTSAPLDIVELHLKQITANYNWILKHSVAEFEPDA